MGSCGVVAVWGITLAMIVCWPVNNDLSYGSVLLVDVEPEPLVFVDEVRAVQMEISAKGLLDLVLRVTHSQAVGEFVGRTLCFDHLDRIVINLKFNMAIGQAIPCRKIIQGETIVPPIDQLWLSQLLQHVVFAHAKLEVADSDTRHDRLARGVLLTDTFGNGITALFSYQVDKHSGIDDPGAALVYIGRLEKQLLSHSTKVP